MPQDHRTSKADFPYDQAIALYQQGQSYQKVAAQIGWSQAQTQRKLKARGITRPEHTSGIPAVSPTSHPEHTAVAPVAPLVTPHGIPDIARQSDLDILRKHGQQILYLCGELSRLANGAPACLLPTVTRV